MTHTCRCGRPSPDTTICDQCTRLLTRALADIPELVADLTITLARQDQIGERSTGRVTERPVPYHATAAVVLRDIHATLATVVRALQTETPEPWPADDSPALAAWLRQRTSRISTHPAADETLHAIQTVTARGWRTIDAPTPRIYAGTCHAERADEHSGQGPRCWACTTHAEHCEEQLYARPGAVAVACRCCSATHDVADRRGQMLDAVRAMLMPLPDIPLVLAGLTGVEVSASTLRSWRARGRLAEHSVDREGHPMYAVADVMALLETAAKRERERNAKREKIAS